MDKKLMSNLRKQAREDDVVEVAGLATGGRAGARMSNPDGPKGGRPACLSRSIQRYGSRG